MAQGPPKFSGTTSSSKAYPVPPCPQPTQGLYFFNEVSQRLGSQLLNALHL